MQKNRRLICHQDNLSQDKLVMSNLNHALTKRYTQISVNGEPTPSNSGRKVSAALLSAHWSMESIHEHS